MKIAYVICNNDLVAAVVLDKDKAEILLKDFKDKGQEYDYWHIHEAPILD